MGVAVEEQETVIQFNRSDSHATIYTSDSTMITKLDHLCEDAPEFYSVDKVETVKEQQWSLINNNLNMEFPYGIWFYSYDFFNDLYEECNNKSLSAADKVGR